MRYLIYYPPTKSSRWIDIVAGTRVQEIIDMIQHEFGFNVDNDSQAETSIVLNHDGSDLKPTWPLADLNVPPGAIIRCLHREKITANLYVHCGFNNQILEFFDDTITFETTIREIRKKISDRIGLPLSTFSLETHDSKRRLYDQMKLFHYDLKPNNHIYLKIWLGYEKFLNSCMKGFPTYYSHDDLTRHYQLQIALYVAAFYGFMELANSALQSGARSDLPVGEHPSRQWSSETTVQDMPELLKCPIHIAVEQGHMKIVDLFVRQSIFCTQVAHPISGFLPYRMASSLSMLSKIKAEKQRYSQIYLYLYDKQFNLKIPLNANGDNVSNLLTSSANLNSLHQSSAHLVFFSLPRYCKIIRWYQRARERVWKKYCVQIDNSVDIKRAYQSKGLLGYKILIDGFHNTFDTTTSNEPIRRVAAGRKSQMDQTDRYIGYTDEERQKILNMEAYMKQFGADERQRAKHAANTNLEKSGHHPLLAYRGLMEAKIKTIDLAPTEPSTLLEDSLSSSEFSNSKDPPNFIGLDSECPKFIVDTQSSSNIHRTQSAAANLTSLEPNKDQHGRNRKAKPMPKTIFKTVVNETEEHEQQNYTLPLIPTSTSNSPAVQSTAKQKLKMVVTTKITSNRQEEMSSVDAYLVSSALIAANDQQQKITAKRELLTQIEQSLKNPVEKPKTRSPSVQANSSMTLEIDPYIPLPDHQIRKSLGPIQSRFDLEIQQATIKSYERYASASTRSTAANCLQEAGFFKRKSWLKQVEIGKEMVKQRTKRLIRGTDDGKINSVSSPMRVISAAPSSYTTRLSTGKAN